MADSSRPHRHLSGLQPDALMAQGLSPGEAAPVNISGVDLETPLGRGGMGTVYLGRQLSLDREVAVKVLAAEIANDPLFLERLEREARVMARLRHPNIVSIYDFQRGHSGAAIVMEFIEGGTLRERLLQHPRGLPVAEVVRLLRQIADGLHAAHSAGVIHRDMKPENVLLDHDGEARVTDFGLAMPTDGDAARLTLTGNAVGTVDYMAPEQLRGGQADVRLDVYALGVIGYELLTGHTPRGHFDPPHRVRPEVPAGLSMAVMKALRANPEERFPSVAAFIAALSTRPRPAWSRLAAIAALLAVVAAVFTVFWKKSPAPGPNTAPAQPGPWRDAIAGTRIPQDIVSGDWQMRDGILLSDESVAIIKLEDQMPLAFDVHAKFTRLSGVNSVALVFHANGGTASVDLDAWNEGLAGVQNIGGESLQNGYGFRFKLENGRSYELLVEVRPEVIRVSVDGEFKKAFPIGGKPLAPPFPWNWNPADRPVALGLATYRSSTRFDKVEWRGYEAP